MAATTLQDSIVFTPREEEYGLLLGEYGRALRGSRRTINDNYNPLHFSNYEYSFVMVVLYLMSLVLAFVQKSVLQRISSTHRQS